MTGIRRHPHREAGPAWKEEDEAAFHTVRPAAELASKPPWRPLNHPIAIVSTTIESEAGKCRTTPLTPAGSPPLDSATSNRLKSLCPSVERPSLAPSKHQVWLIGTVPRGKTCCREPSPIGAHSGNPVHWRAWSPLPWEKQSLTGPSCFPSAIPPWPLVPCHGRMKASRMTTSPPSMTVCSSISGRTREERPASTRSIWPALPRMGEQGVGRLPCS